MTYILKHRGLHHRKPWGKNRHIWCQWHLRGFIKIQGHLRLSWASSQVECKISQRRRSLTLTWTFKVTPSLCNVLWVLPTLRRLSRREILSTTSMSWINKTLRSLISTIRPRRSYSMPRFSSRETTRECNPRITYSAHRVCSATI